MGIEIIGFKEREPSKHVEMERHLESEQELENERQYGKTVQAVKWSDDACQIVLQE